MTSEKNSLFIYNRIKSEIKEIAWLHDSYHVITVDQEREKVALGNGSLFSTISKNRCANKKITY